MPGQQFVFRLGAVAGVVAGVADKAPVKLRLDDQVRALLDVAEHRVDLAAVMAEEEVVSGSMSKPILGREAVVSAQPWPAWVAAAVAPPASVSTGNQRMRCQGLARSAARHRARHPGVSFAMAPIDPRGADMSHTCARAEVLA